MTYIIKKFKSLTATDITALICLFASFIFLFVLSSFSGTISDEAFYLTIPLRIMNGDGLFTDEWHISQLSSVLLYPAVKLFINITGGTTGIILFMRRLFAVFQLSAGLYIYTGLRKKGIMAVFISTFFMLFSVIGIAALSYNTIGLGVLFVLAVTAYNLQNKPSLIKMFFLGTLIAVFILCQPFGLIFYAIYFAAVCYFLFRKNVSDRKCPFEFTVKSFFCTVAGILPVLFFFLFILLKNSDFSTIFRCIPGILSDVEHFQASDDYANNLFSFADFFKNMTYPAGTVPLIILVLCSAAAIFIKRKNRALSTFITIAGFTVFVVSYYVRLIFSLGNIEGHDMNYIVFPLALIGLPLFLLCERKDTGAFIAFWLSGILYAVCMAFSSNLGLHAGVNGYIISSTASFIFMNDLIKEFYEEKEKLSNYARLTVKTVFITLGFLPIIVNIAGTLISQTAFKTAEVTCGVYEKINLPSDQALIYTDIYKDVTKIKETATESDKIFVLDNIPAAYLDGQFQMGTFSGWFIAEQLAVDEIQQRFLNYYEIFPENIPDYVYVPAYKYTQYGMKSLAPKYQAINAYYIFEGSEIKLDSGILIKVTGLKYE